MTKLLSTRVVVPCEDGVSIEQLKQAMREHLAALPVQSVGDGESGGRIHWAAVDVIRHHAVNGAAPPARKKKAAAAPTQGELVS
jgi:hypothetical protein